MYTDTVQKLPTNSESNIMRCSTVPRFKYLPIRLVNPQILHLSLHFCRITCGHCFPSNLINLLPKISCSLIWISFIFFWLSSAPALSSRAAAKTSLPISSDDISSRSSWKAYANGELSGNIDLDDNSSFGVAAPFLKSFMQVILFV